MMGMDYDIDKLGIVGRHSIKLSLKMLLKKILAFQEFFSSVSNNFIRNLQ